MFIKAECSKEGKTLFCLYKILRFNGHQNTNRETETEERNREGVERRERERAKQHRLRNINQI